MVTVGYSRLQKVTEQVTAGYRVVTVVYSRLQLVTERVLWVTADYSKLQSGYSGLQQVTAGYREDTVGHPRLQQVTEWLQ